MEILFLLPLEKFNLDRVKPNESKKEEEEIPPDPRYICQLVARGAGGNATSGTSASRKKGVFWQFNESS